MKFSSEKNLDIWYLEDKLKDPPHPTTQQPIYQHPKLKTKTGFIFGLPNLILKILVQQSI